MRCEVPFMALASQTQRAAHACAEGTDAVGCGRMGLDTGTRTVPVPDRAPRQWPVAKAYGRCPALAKYAKAAWTIEQEDKCGP